MITLIKYEIKKILTKKAMLYTFPCIIIIIAFLFILPFFQEKTVTTDGNNLYGVKAINYLKSQPNIEVTDQTSLSLINKYRKLSKDKNNYLDSDSSTKYFNDRLTNSFINPNNNQFQFIANVHSGPDVFVDYTELRMIRDPNYSVFDNLKFNYKTILKGKKLNSKYNYSKEEQKYWNKKVKSIPNKMIMGYTKGWESLSDRIAVLFIPILFICILISSTFIKDIQLNTNNIILPTIKGTKSLAVAKLIASYSIGIFYYIIFGILAFIPIMLLYGFKGWNIPIQQYYPYIPYNWSYLKTILVQWSLGLLVLGGLITVILLISLYLKKTISTIIFSVVLIVIPTVLPKTTNFLFYNLLVKLLPTTQFWNLYTDWTSYNIFGHICNVYEVNILLYALIILFGIPMIIKKSSKVEQLL